MKSLLSISFLLIFVFLSKPYLAQAESITGVSRVIDGDTLQIQGARIRLHGIDAPETKQSCKNEQLEPWPCGQLATNALREKINTKKIRCKSDKTDRYKRRIAICYLGDTNLNQWLVLNGWALAYRKYSRDYIESEDVARSNSSGVWSGEFISPWKWRRGERLKY